MVTGDHPSTAAAIGREVGLVLDDELVLEGARLPEDDRALGALLDHDGVVISRVSPEQKLRVARALQGRGHVVAMTGDGVNDGPALQEADVGVAMGTSGTDVAREAADLVLLDDDFATIVAAIEQGRATYANIRRFLTYHLTDNVAELTPFVIWAFSGGSFPARPGRAADPRPRHRHRPAAGLGAGSRASGQGRHEAPARAPPPDGPSLASARLRRARSRGSARGDDGFCCRAAGRWMEFGAVRSLPATCCLQRPVPLSPPWCWGRWPTPTPAGAPPAHRGGWGGSATVCFCGRSWLSSPRWRLSSERVR